MRGSTTSSPSFTRNPSNEMLSIAVAFAFPEQSPIPQRVAFFFFFFFPSFLFFESQGFLCCWFFASPFFSLFWLSLSLMRATHVLYGSKPLHLVFPINIMMTCVFVFVCVWVFVCVREQLCVVLGLCLSAPLTAPLLASSVAARLRVTEGFFTCVGRLTQGCDLLSQSGPH